MDIDRLLHSHVSVLGAGGSAGLIGDLARCGIQHFSIADPQRLEHSNISRQGHAGDDVGRTKVDAVAALLRRINPEVAVTRLPLDFCALSDEEIDDLFGHTDLFIFATDRFRAQARGNEVALRLRKPALWIGLYRSGQAGEIIFWYPGQPACFRCLCAKRYELQAAAQSAGRSLDPPSDGATIFDIQLVDSIAGQIAVGLLTRGAENRFGRLIAQLGERNFLQVKIDPTWSFGGRDVIREQLGIAEECPAYVAWNTIARCDPTHGEPPCPDCVRFLGRMPGRPSSEG